MLGNNIIIAIVVVVAFLSGIDGAAVQIVDANPAPVTDVTPTPIIDANPSTEAPKMSKAGEVIRAVDQTKIALLAGSGQVVGDAIELIVIRSDFKYPATSAARAISTASFLIITAIACSLMRFLL
jgi:hypothetical protein